jgi:ankyrin repeat protein
MPQDGSTALLEACYKGHTATVKLLLEAGANKDAQDYTVCHSYGSSLIFERDSAPIYRRISLSLLFFS